MFSLSYSMFTIEDRFVFLLTSCQALWRFGGGAYCGGWGSSVDEGVADGADDYPILLHFCPQAVEEGLNRVFGGSI